MPRPAQCPVCHSPRVAEILWGRAAFSEELERELDEGLVVLGGCVLSGNEPDWHCTKCGHEWVRAST